jgi:hypothetical protein
VENPTVLVTCASGYEPSAESGSCQVSRDCVAAGPGASTWSGTATCDRVVCPSFTIANAVVSDSTVRELQEATISCNAGYALVRGTSTVASCNPNGPCAAQWVGHVECEPVPCPALTVANSEATAADTGADVESDDVLVTCASGFAPSVGSDFTEH